MLACKSHMCGYLLFAATLRSDLGCQASVNRICTTYCILPLWKQKQLVSTPHRQINKQMHQLNAC